MVQILFKDKAVFVKGLGENNQIMMSVTSLMEMVKELKRRTGNSNEDQMFVIIRGRGDEEMEVRVTNTR